MTAPTIPLQRQESRCCADCGETKRIEARGLCLACYSRRRRAGTRAEALPAPRPLLDRIIERIEFPSVFSACWNWKGAIHPGSGYSRINVSEGGKQHGRFAYRVLYEQVVGRIPDGLVLDHLCRNRRCVNPLHLEPVTVRENNLRGNGAGGINARKASCPRGHEYRQYDGYRRCVECERGRQQSRQSTQQASCPYCRDLVWGLLSGCDKPACIAAEIDEAARIDRLEDRDA